MTTVTDTVMVAAPALTIKHFVLGKTWRWENPEPHMFLRDTHQIASQLQQGKRIFHR
jgi:hypothetical protein